MKNDIKILLAEDSGPMRKIEMAELRSLGFSNILEAEDGNAAIGILREHPDTDLIISDWNMPGKSGYQVLTWVRANPAYEHIPFLMATAQGDRKQARRAMEAGVSSILAKPFDAEELKKKIDEVMNPPEKGRDGKEPEQGPQMGRGGKVRFRVGHIQITDHLILGVLHHLIESGEMTPRHFELEPVRMSGWNPVEKALEEGSVDAACMLAPIAMDLFGGGAPIRMILLTHRNGSMFVRNRLGEYCEPFQDFFDGKSVLIPHKMSIHHMLAHRFFSGMGLKLGVAGQPDIDVQYEVVAPVMMPGFMEGNPDVAGFIVAEPIASLSIAAGIAEMEFLSGALWENHPCCVLGVRDDFIRSQEAALYEFVEMLVQAGRFMELYPEKAAETGTDFLDPDGRLGLSVSLLRQVLSAGLRTGDLYPEKEDFEKIQDYMLNEMKVGKKIDLDSFIDTRFADAARGNGHSPHPKTALPAGEDDPGVFQSYNSEITTETEQKISQKRSRREIPEEKAVLNGIPRMTDEEDDHSDTIRISTEILDQLMASVGELVLVRNRELISADMSDPVSRGIAQRLDQVTGELQETILLTRMQPIGNVFGRMPRIVRELGKKYGKQIEISFKGRETEVDKAILESLARPLSDVITSCCRRGIESPEERKAAGKPELGRIELSAEKTAGEIHIRIRDDGRGMDAESVKKSLIRKGIRSEKQLFGMAEKEILSLLFLPEFPADSIADGEGEGCGNIYAEIRKRIEIFKGTAEIESVAGKGSTFHFRFPLSLAIVPSLVVVSGAYRYVIPQMNVEELLCLYDNDITEKIETVGNQRVFRLRNRLLPLIRLKDVLGDVQEKPEIPASPEESLTFAVVRSGKHFFGLIVDRVLGSEDIVVKAMHPALADLWIYSGATVMGDGKVSLILNIDGIARHAGIRFSIPNENGMHPDGAKEDRQTVLLFKNGRFEQFALALPLIRRVERIRMADIEKVGDREFISVEGVSTLVLRPDRILSVSPVIMKEEMFLILPKFIRRPFGILISQIIDTTTVSAELSTESHMEDGLLGTAIVGNQMTLFIDISRLIEIAEPEGAAERK